MRMKCVCLKRVFIFLSVFVVFSQASDEGECEWKVLNNTNKQGGKLINEIDFVEDCKKACMLQQGCSNGFDWDNKIKGCFISIPNNLQFGHAGVDHYYCQSMEEKILEKTISRGPEEGSEEKGIDCWRKHSRSEYKSLEETNVNGINRCKSYCFDLNQLSESEGGGCNVITTYRPGNNNQWCYLVKTAKPDDGKRVYNRYDITRFMNNHCKYSSCWSEVKYDEKVYLKEVASLTEKQCRFRCMETWECFNTAYRNNKCYMQSHNDILDSVSSESLGTIYRLKRKCKDESCWDVYNDRDMSWSGLVNKPFAKDEFHCREFCLKVWHCNVYTWHYNETDQTNKCWIMEARNDRKFTDSGKMSSGVNSWVLKKKCRDWNAGGFIVNQ